MPTREKISPTLLKFGRNMRTEELDESLLRELGESMRVKQLQPIVTASDYTVVVGNRRGRAALLIGLDSVDVERLDEMPSESQRRMYQFAENWFREDVSDWDKCQTCYELVQLNLTWNGKDVAEFLKVDPSMVVRFMSFTKCIPTVRDALKEGKIGIGMVYTISKYPEEQQQLALENGLNGSSRDELERVRRKSGKRKRNSSSAGLKRLSLPMPSGVIITFAGKGLSLCEAIDAGVEAIKEMRKGAAQGMDAKTFQAAMLCKVKAGS